MLEIEAMGRDNDIFVVPGDLTQLHADAVAYSTSSAVDEEGHMFAAFARNLPGFCEQYRHARRRLHNRPVGETAWLPLDGVPRGVTVVIATDGNDDPLEQSRRAVARAIERSVEELRRRVGDERRLLVALPTLLAGTPEARTARRELAEAQIDAARATLDRLARVDVAFIAYTHSNYHIYLSARRERAAPVEPEPPAPLVTALRRGECVLFAGAGLSVAAGLPSWQQLIDTLARDLGHSPGSREVGDYLGVAELHRARFGADPARSLPSLVKRLYGDEAAARPTLAHYLLASLPFRLVITTNWDDLLERTLLALRRRAIRVVDEEAVPDTGRTDAVSVVKLHGDAREPSNIVLSRDDYRSYFDRHPAMALLLEGLLLNQTFFFVGYSLRDPNFRQIHDRIAGMLKGAKRPAYALTRQHEGDEWRERHLELLPVLPDDDDCARELHRWLDRLAEATAGAPQVFLTPAERAGPSPPLAQLRATLLDVADETVRLCDGAQSLSPDDAKRVASTLEFLVAHGWRPEHRARLWRMWLALAERVDDATERDHLLSQALGCAENLDDILLVRERFEAAH